MPDLQSYDVLVVGAGPAGAAAAYDLARAGARVALLEKERMPRGKPCGGGLTAKAYGDLPYEITPLVRSRCARVEVRCGRRRFRIDAGEEDVWMVCRPEFDRFLAEQAAAAGADFRQGEPVTALTQDGEVCLETPRGAYRAPVAIAADGANGFVARAAGLRARDFAPYGLAIEAEVAVSADLRGDLALIDLGYAGGYAWVFPKGNVYNVGVFSVRPARFASLRHDFDRFLAGLDLPLAGPIYTEARKIPVGGWRGPLVAGRVLAAGDAAGLADPFFGEGIAFALRSGRLAARETLAFLAGERPDLSSYESSLQRTLGLDLRALRRAGRLFYRHPGAWSAALAHFPPLRHLAIAYCAGKWSWGGGWRG